MKIATTIGEMYNYAPIPADAVRCYKGTGFRYLDYSFYSCHTGNSPFLLDSDKEWKQQVEDAGNAAADCGFKFVQAHAPGYNSLLESPDLDHPACLRAMERSVEACGMLGIPTIVVHGCSSPTYPYPEGRDGFMARNREFFDGMLKMAEKYGVCICVENTTGKHAWNRYYPRSPEELLDFAAAMEHPLVKCCWDTGHSVMEDKYDQYDILQTLGSELAAIHVHDNDSRKDQHIAPYCGKLDMDRFIKGLIDIGYTGYFTYESNDFLNKQNSTGPLMKLPLELRQESLALLYKIGKFMLETYNVFEE